jgi:hypothetical protein
MSKPVYYLTLDEAHGRLLRLREKAGSGLIPLLSSGHGPSREFCVCKIELGRAATRDAYKRVTRAGQPIVLITTVSKKDPLITLDGALAILEQLKVEAGSGEIPVLFGGNKDYLELCDFWISHAGAANLYRFASRGGQPVLNVMLTPPDKSATDLADFFRGNGSNQHI